MIKYWQTHQEYCRFLHEVKVHFCYSKQDIISISRNLTAKTEKSADINYQTQLIRELLPKEMA